MAVIGGDSVKAMLARKSQAIQQGVKDLVQIYTHEIEEEAINNAPRAGDKLAIQGSSKGLQIQDNIAGFISASFHDDGYTGRVTADFGGSLFFIYVEFRTGSMAAQYLATLPKEIQAYARQFYINGKGRIIGNPFLLPAYYKNQPIFIKELRKMLKERV